MTGPRIDAHQHFWQVERRDYAWLTEDSFPELYRDFEPSDLAPLIAACGIDRTVLVQGAETASETEFLLGIANATPFVAGVVGWTDLLARDAPLRIEYLAGRSKLVGVRPMLEIIEDDDWILDPRLAPGLRAVATCGLRFDALIRPRHLPVLARLLAAHPELQVVIDHAAKPDIAGGEIDRWSRDIRAVAASSRAFVKLSGLATEAAAGWNATTLSPYADVLFEAFGAERIMWGSDWPVLNVAGEYQTWHAVAQTLTAGLSADQRDWIFGRTAARFYGLSG